MAGEEKPGQDLIRSSSQPNCYFCGSPGDILYSNIKDKIFSAPGKWTVRICPNSNCRLSWLDPVPLKEDMFRAYLNYFTHQTNNADRRKSDIPSEMLRWPIKLIVSLLKRMLLITSERKQINLMYLNNKKPGRLLEVGCGAGHLLAKLRGLGWKVEGQEVDPKAAENAKNSYGIAIHLGELEEVGFSDDSFDTIIMNHVIEHIHDPIALLNECHRILRPSGILVATTPNIESCGHQYFQSCWTGLDPPRHLYIFSVKSLQQIVIKTNFNKYRVWTTASRTQPIAVVSFEVRDYHCYQPGTYPHLFSDIKGMLFQIWARVIHIIKPSSGDECVLWLEK